MALVGALGLFAAAPAQADVWSATLTPQTLRNMALGCANSRLEHAKRCSTATTLSDDDFTVGGASYSVQFISLNNRVFLAIAFDAQISTALNLCVGSTSFPLTVGSTTSRWLSRDLTWTAGTPVSLSIGVASSCASQSSNANLSGLTASSSTRADGTFTPLTLTPSTFSAGTTSYAATVADTITHAKLTPTVADTGKATVAVQGTTVTSGSASIAIALSEGANAITVRVTAESGTTKDYTVTVTRQAPQPIAPNAPPGLTVTPGDGELTARWTAPPGVNVSRYEAQIKLKSASLWPGTDTDATGTSHTFRGLVNGSAYQVRVRTVAVGQSTPSDWSASVEGTPRAPRATPTVLLSASPNPVNEGSPVTVTATLSAALTRNVDIPVTLTDDSAEPSDHGTLPSFIAITAGSTASSVQITTMQDADDEDETFTVALDTANLPSSVTAGSPASVRITIDDGGGGRTTRSSDASLRGLLISAGSLTFDPARTSYAVAVAHEVESVQVTPTVNHAAATVAVNGAAVASGTPSGSIALSVGENAVEVVVTAEDGTTRTYRVTVTRRMKTPSSDASLTGLLISAGSLTFDPARTSYAVAVAHEVESVQVTPTVNHAGATVAVNGAAVASGTPSGSIALSVGENAVEVVVTAEDGATRTYRVTVTRGAKILGAAEKEHVDKVGTALLGLDDPGVYPPAGGTNQ